MSGCNFISKLNKLRKSSSDSIDNVDSFDGFKEYMHVVRDAEKNLKAVLLGALYEDFDGIIYAFDLKESGITLNHCVHDFIMKYKVEIEKLNYYSWARFLEQVNSENALVRVLEKLELATPRRNDLSVYREILRKEFEEDTCFYCGTK